MELRRILYGYRKEQFNFYVVPEEGLIVREIFKEYVDGKPLKAIAESLTNRQIVYYKDKTDWTKNAVCRILENKHYIGDSEYPKIIDENIFLKAENLRLSKGGKREKDSQEIIYLKSHLFCGVCGNKFMLRAKYTDHERWVCENKCHKNYEYLDDKILVNKILNILRFVKNNSSVLSVNTEVKRYEPTREVILKEKQVKDMIFEPKPMFQPIKSLIYSSINDKYNAMDFDTSKQFTTALCEYISNHKMKADILDLRFMKIAVSKIVIEADGKIKIRFLNGQEISERQVYENE